MHPGSGQTAEERLWSAWSALECWNRRAADDFGDDLAKFVLLLWTARCFGANDDAAAMCLDLVDSCAPDSALAEIAEVAFALGAGWAEALVLSRGLVDGE